MLGLRRAWRDAYEDGPPEPQRRWALPRWLDRIWLTLVAISFLVMVPIWLILSAERMWWIATISLIAVAFVIRYYSTTSPK